ncbi:hypothetical protein V6Z12_A02G112800 [Gossypium hirsutum]
MQELMARQVWGINRTLNNRKLRKMPRGCTICGYWFYSLRHHEIKPKSSIP